jgi:hypothetical protein
MEAPTVADALTLDQLRLFLRIVEAADGVRVDAAVTMMDRHTCC